MSFPGQKSTVPVVPGNGLTPPSRFQNKNLNIPTSKGTGTLSGQSTSFPL